MPKYTLIRLSNGNQINWKIYWHVVIGFIYFDIKVENQVSVTKRLTQSHITKPIGSEIRFL